MKRRSLLLLAAAAFSCSSTHRVQEFSFPQTVAGGWTLKEQHDLPKSNLPAVMDPQSVTRIQQGIYTGPGQADVRVYHMTSSAVALDMTQRWYPEADQVVFYKDTFFITTKYSAPDRKPVQQLLTQLQKEFDRILK